jgi:transcription elongation GreA/GreB family factor
LAAAATTDTAWLADASEQLKSGTLPDLGDHARPGDVAWTGLEEARKRVAELRDAIEEAVVVAGPADSRYVQLGSQVRVETPDGEEDFVVGGHVEASLLHGRRSFKSALARAVYGHCAGEAVWVEAPAGVYEAKILSVAVPERLETS